MKITIKHTFFKKLGRQAGTAASGAAGAIGSAAGRLKGSAENRVQRIRLERAIRDLEDEIDLQMCSIGELVYAAQKGSSSESDDMSVILEYVDGLYEELEGHQQQLNAL